jgi:hypothetical protein
MQLSSNKLFAHSRAPRSHVPSLQRASWRPLHLLDQGRDWYRVRKNTNDILMKIGSTRLVLNQRHLPLERGTARSTILDQQMFFVNESKERPTNSIGEIF